MRSARFITIILFGAAFCYATTAPAQGPDNRAVSVAEGEVELPTYEFPSRELEPALFGNSTIEGEYPLPIFVRPYKSGSPVARKYKALFIENEYLRLTVVPDFGGRVYSLYDKVKSREVFYKNDVLKFSPVNPKRAWPVGNIEITGPHDHHMLTVDGEPYWFTRVVHNPDSSVSVVMSSIDPYYRMKLNYTATLYPGLAAMELTVFCYNRRDTREPFMLWVNAGLPAGPGTRFIYPMGRTIGHTTSEVADWPYYSGVDYSWFKNNKHMLGVFGIDIYDNFLGAYDFDRDYGTFRWADRRIVQGMKMWTWGKSQRAESIERGYTDKAGPYVEVQSGRNVWDGHYEWLPPNSHEGWNEWWFPVAGIGGLTTTNRDLALNLKVSPDPAGKSSAVVVGLSANRAIPGARITLTAGSGKLALLDKNADLAPGKPFLTVIKNIAADSASLTGMQVRVTDSRGATVLAWDRPDRDPAHREYTPFTSPLERPQVAPEKMSTEKLVLEAETRIKEMHPEAATELLARALAQDPGCSRAHLSLGHQLLEAGRADSAIVHLEKVIERDPYNEEAFYYLALGCLEQGDTVRAGRELYFIPPTSAYYGQREFLLGKLAFESGDLQSARGHLEEAERTSGSHLYARDLLALVLRLKADKAGALAQLAEVEKIDPTDRWAAAERYYLTGDSLDLRVLEALLGGQSQESLELSSVYRELGRWREALDMLEITSRNNADVYGTPAIYWYTRADCLVHLGQTEEAAASYRKGRDSRGNIDRFPFRRESLDILARAVVFNPSDVTARYLLGCLLYHRGETGAAIFQWKAVQASDPKDFSSRRALGLAYAEKGYGIDLAAAELEAAIEINPTHSPTFADLSYLYSREGAFDRQLALLRRALAHSPGDDNLIEGLVTTNLLAGNYMAADSLISGHTFEQRHRNYSLRDKYRFLRYALGDRAFKRGDYEAARREFEKALYPPSSLGADDFQFQTAPRVHYYLGLVLDKQGRAKEARAEYEKASSGWEYLKGDRDSYNSENVYMALSLENLGQKEEAAKVLDLMAGFARTDLDDTNRGYRAEAHYLLALILKQAGDTARARELLEQAAEAEPDLVGVRLELRGDVVDPLPGTETAPGK